MRSFASLGAIGAFALVVAGASCGDSGNNPLPVGGSGGAKAATTSSTGGQGGTGGSAPTGVLIPGLSGKVTAIYDANGLLHLSCASDNDCFAALGYFHASNRFFFMDFVRNLVRGSLASLVKGGDLVLEKDYANRQFFATPAGDPLEDVLYNSASDQVKGHLDAYTKGVNAWIGDMRAGLNNATLTTEYDFPLIVKSAIRDWQPQDSAAIGLYVLQDLSDNSGSELTAGQQYPLVKNVDLATDLFSPEPVFDAYTVDAATQGLTTPGFVSPLVPARLAPVTDLLHQATDHMRQVGSGWQVNHAGEIGSNDWVVGPSRTTGGNALLANDPHLALTNPSIWFAVELDSKSAGTGVYHVAGSTFPGLPSVMIGHNENIGWGVTTAYYDLSDEYVEDLSPDGTKVLFNGQEVPIFTKDFTFQDAKSGMPVTKTFEWVPQHGPIVSKDMSTMTAISVRWSGQEGGTDLDAFFGLARSASVNDARTALQAASSANQNFVIIDKQGNIGWFPYAQVPSRPWASPTLPASLPLPGNGTAEWQGKLPLNSLPQLLNPPNAFIATANNDMTGASADGDPYSVGDTAALQAWDKADGTREQRIVDLIGKGANAHSPDTMHQIQGDTYSLYGKVAVPLILTAAQTGVLTPDEQKVVDALTAWQYTCPTGLATSDPMGAKSTDATETSESIGCMAFHTTLYAIVHEALGDEATDSTVDLSLDTVDLRLVERALRKPASLVSGQALWDDITTTAVTETRDDILRRGISDAAVVLAAIGAPDEWRWGRYHTLSLRSIFDSFGIATYNVGPFAAPGGQFTVNVGNPLSRVLPAATVPPTAPDFAFANGPSVRFVVEARPDGLKMTYELPGGQDLHKDGQFYNNLLPNWLTNTPIDFPFGPGAVTAPAATVVVSPSP